jgi:hypothetical protein
LSLALSSTFTHKPLSSLVYCLNHWRWHGPGPKAGETFVKVDFADIGTPQGKCGGFSIDTACTGTPGEASQVVAKLCLGKSTCEVAPNTATLNPSNPMICDGVIKSSAVQLSCGKSPHHRPPLPHLPLSLHGDQPSRSGDATPSCLTATPMNFDAAKGYYTRQGWKVGLGSCPTAGNPAPSSNIFNFSTKGQLQVGSGPTCLASVPLNGPQLWSKPLDKGSNAGESFCSRNSWQAPLAAAFVVAKFVFTMVCVCVCVCVCDFAFLLNLTNLASGYSCGQHDGLQPKPRSATRRHPRPYLWHWRRQ